MKRRVAMRIAGWSLIGLALCAMFFTGGFLSHLGSGAGGGGGLPTSDLLAIGADQVTPGRAPEAAVPEPLALDLFQLALALMVGLAYLRLRS